MNYRVLASMTFAVSTLGVAPALAGKPKVELLCGVFVKDAITDIVPNPKNPKIDQPVACALHLPDAVKGVFKGVITTRRHLVNPTTGDRADVEVMGEGGELSHKQGADAVDVEVVLTPSKENGQGEIPFEPCESFDITGTVTDASGVVFQKTLKVVQTCPKAKVAAPPAERRAPPPPPPPARPAGGAGNPVADDIFTFRQKETWTAYDVQIDGVLNYVIGSCYDPGTNKPCLAQMFTQQGKQVAKVDMDFGAEGSGEPDQGKIAAARAELAKALKGETGNKLVQHVMGAKKVSYDQLGFTWDKKKGVLTVLDGKKTFKKHDIKKLLGKNNDVVSLSVYFFEAGSPPAAIVAVEYVFTGGEYGGLQNEHKFFVVPLPEAMSGD